MTGYYLISKKNLKCIGSKGNKPEQNQWHNARTFYIHCRLWHIWKKIMQSNKNSKMFKIIKSKGNLVAIGEYNGKKIFMTEERITKGANKMKHTPTKWKSIGKKVIDARGFTVADCDFSFSNTKYSNEANAEFIVHAVNMHSELVQALINLLAFPQNESIKDMARKAISQAERK